MTIETDADIAALQKIGAIVANTLEYMKSVARPGMSTAELDELGSVYLCESGARSAPQLTYNFPGFTCISVNNEVAHGIPGDRILQAGDLVNIDVSAELEGYFGDTGGSFQLEPRKSSLSKLLEATRDARAVGIAAARADANISDIGKAVEKVARKNAFRVLRDLGSHGVGRGLHEEPKFIPSYFDPADKRTLKKGMVITIEPFLTTGPQFVTEAQDGWTLFVKKGQFGAQFEHTLVITEGAPLIMTLPTKSFA